MLRVGAPLATQSNFLNSNISLIQPHRHSEIQLLERNTPLVWRSVALCVHFPYFEAQNGINKDECDSQEAEEGSKHHGRV